jgi:hypothetical protein
LVPAGTASLLVEAYVFGSPFSVTLGGQALQLVPLESFAHYTLWGANIPSSMAGQSETLSFVEPASATVVPTILELDDISFSPTAVIPEPSEILLTGLGGLFFAVYRRLALKQCKPSATRS